MTIEKSDKNNHNRYKKAQQGVTDYPILDFDDKALQKLSAGVHETLKHSRIKPNRNPCFLLIKRFFDVVVSSFALLISGIPILLFALLIFLQDGGNPFFSQVRLTKDGKTFRMIKLRSMCKDAEKKFREVQSRNNTDGLAFKCENDPRITGIGRFIRKTYIDELPQFWNVLKGDMSIIGPRPPLPREVVLYTPHHMNKFLVKGGLACAAQADGYSNFEEWIDSDIRYIKNQSLIGDLILCFRLVIVVIRHRGAQ